MAAVLACGPGALLMGAAAAYLYGLLKGEPPPPVVKTRTGRDIEGIETHRTRSKDRGTTWRGIPLTTVPRTLMDLARSMPEKELAVACHHAQVRFGTRPEQTRGRVRRVLEGHIPVTLSALESRFLKTLDEANLPRPQTNRETRGRTYVDCRWPEPSPHGRARRLSLPPHPPRLGERPPPRARGACARRPAPPLHLRRRLRGPAPDARGAARPARIEWPPWSTGIAARTRTRQASCSRPPSTSSSGPASSKDNAVLDLGTGTGNAALLAAKAGAEITAVDPSPRLLNVAEARIRQGRFEVAKAEDLPFDDASFDRVLSLFAVIFSEQPQKAASEITRVLKPDGRALITAWEPVGADGRARSASSAPRRPGPPGCPSASASAGGEPGEGGGRCSPSAGVETERAGDHVPGRSAEDYSSGSRSRHPAGILFRETLTRAGDYGRPGAGEGGARRRAEHPEARLPRLHDQ